MLFQRKGNKSDSSNTASAPASQVVDLGTREGALRISKNQLVRLKRTAQGAYTLIAHWGRKDYDLYALVEYMDGHTEVVSCFGTASRPYDFSTRTRDNAVVHVTGDKATSDRGGDDLPQEVIHVTLNPNIRAIAMVVYSAQNSGVGSFHRYRVSTHVIEGRHNAVPNTGTHVSIEAANANRDNHVYTLVPVVIHNTPEGPTVEAVELYSGRNSEQRPVLQNGRVTMDAGEDNAAKDRPNG